MRLLLIADTHVPKRAKDLPAQVWDEVDQADVVVHAGDWVDPALLDALSSRAAHLIGCWGNNDDGELGSGSFGGSPSKAVLVKNLALGMQP